MLNPKEVGRKTWPKNPDWVSLLNKKALHQSSHERVIINLLWKKSLTALKHQAITKR